MRSYRPDELFDEAGRLLPELADMGPKGGRRMGANPRANGGALLRDVRMTECRRHAVEVPSPGAVAAQDTIVPSRFPPLAVLSFAAPVTTTGMAESALINDNGLPNSQHG